MQGQYEKKKHLELNFSYMFSHCFVESVKVHNQLSAANFTRDKCMLN